MQVLLDGQPIAVERASLAGALQAASASAQRQGRIIIEVKADGVALSDEKLGNPSDEPSAIGELRLMTAEPRLLVRQTILDAIEALDSAKAKQTQAAEMIQSGNPEEALGVLQVAMVTWQAVRDVVARGGAVLNIDLETLRFPGTEDTFTTATQGLLTNLKQLREALDTQDWSALSDIIGYDLDAQAGVWRGLLTGLSEHVSSMPPPSPKASR